MIEVEASIIDPYVHGRVFAFSELAPVWPVSFLERVGIRFKQIVGGFARSSSKRRYLALFGALDWIGASNNPHCRAVVTEVKERGRILSVSEWEDTLFAYRDHLISVATSDCFVDNTISWLRPVLARLSAGGLLPVTSTPLPGVKYTRRRRRHLRSVAEAGATNNNDTESDYIEFLRDRFYDVCKNSGTALGVGESADFIDGLSAELSFSGNLPRDPASAIRCVLERRLDALRSRATAIVEVAIRRHTDGLRLLSHAQIDGAEFERAYHGCALNDYEKNQLVLKLFPHKNVTEEQRDQGIANLLSLIQQQCGGLPPTAKGDEVGQYGAFFGRRYRAYGGIGSLVPMLHPDLDAVGAVLTLYLVESGSNICVGRTLDRECMEASDLDGYRRISGHKARAKGKPIIVDLPESSSAVRAIEWLLSVGGPLQAAAKKDSDRMFLIRIGKQVRLMSENWYTNWFKDFAASTPGLEEIDLVPSMLRPSVLLHANLANDGRLSTGMAIGQHGLDVAQGYQNKWPSRLLYDDKVRHFHTAFEALVMSSIDDAAMKLGVTNEQFEARLGKLRASGLGTFCRDERGRPGEKSGKCSTLDCWNDCPHLLIIAEVENIARLQLWQTSLRSVQPEWERDRSERWDRVWLPWLCLTDVVEEKMARGSLLKVWNAAMQRAAELSSQPGYVAPKPW